jgi:hypothetical protein
MNTYICMFLYLIFQKQASDQGDIVEVSYVCTLIKEVHYEASEYVNTYTCVYMYLYLRISIYMYLCIYVYIYVFMYVYIHVNTFI